MAQEVFTSTGAGSWTCPIGVKQVLVECWGGGGGGIDDTYGGGGGGGAFASSIVNVQPGKAYAYSVGTAGTGGLSPTAGGDSYWVDTSTILAKAGQPGAAWPASAAGGASASCVGTTKYSGGAGGIGNPNGAGGGGSAGPDGVGLRGYNNSAESAYGGAGDNGSGGAGGTGKTTPGGPGTSNVLDGGGGGGAANNAAGGAAGSPGGGGGGGETGGGAGARGQVRLTYTFGSNDASFLLNLI